MTTLDEKICEQLSAWMDGELPADEARFLARRLASEPALRARWERMQLASACQKGHSLRLMPAAMADRVALAIAEPAVDARTRRPWLGWAVAASVALAAVVLVPNGSRPGGPSDSVVAQASDAGTAPPLTVPDLVPTPSSADLVAGSRDSTIETPVASSHGPAASRAVPANVVVASQTGAGPQSPADFPLAAGNDGKAWPRSPLAGSGDDPAMEAYLIRHNQMMGDEGLSGFVPYVDVVTNDPEGADAGDQSGANR
jgi:Anti sigma-E protein RseA, N-terminal domain